jgi:hypothetical protein
VLQRIGYDAPVKTTNISMNAPIKSSILPIIIVIYILFLYYFYLLTLGHLHFGLNSNKISLTESHISQDTTERFFLLIHKQLVAESISISAVLCRDKKNPFLGFQGE